MDPKQPFDAFAEQNLMDSDAKDQFDKLSGLVIACAMRVHSELGPGLFEEVYKVCLKHELTTLGFAVRSEVGLPVIYRGANLDVGYRLDLLVEETIIVELKSINRLTEVHKAQLLTYLKLARKELGLIFNFNVPHLRNGIIRVVNSFPSRPPCPSR